MGTHCCLSPLQIALFEKRARCVATLTGLEPATSAVTGRRANQLRYRALLWCLSLG